MKNLILTELQLGATDWANVSDRRLDRDPVVITRGKSATENAASPSSVNLTLNNTGGVFSPRNPSSPIAGLLGRNTPLRVSVAKGKYGMVLGLPGTTESVGRAEAGDTAGTSVTGDLDVRVDMEILPDSSRLWTTGNFDVISKYNNNDAGRSYALYVVGGSPHLAWFPLGTAASVRVIPSSIPLPGPTTGRRAIRATLDVNNGAGGVEVRFYTAPTIAGPWTQLGATQTSAGTSSIFDGNAPTRVGGAGTTSTWSWGFAPHCTVYKAEVYNGIGGALVASPDFAAQPLDPVPFAFSNFSDAQGNNWGFFGLADSARIWYGDIYIRGFGEIAELPPRWDPSHSDKYIPVVANGMLRRLGQGKSPVATGLRDFILRSDNVDALAAYYPLSGGEGTTYSLNLAPLNYYLQTRFFGQQVLNSGGFVQSPVFTYGKEMGASWLGSGMELNATGESYMRGDVATADDNCALDFVFQSPSLGVLTVEIQDYSVNLWKCILDTSANAGTLEVRFTAADTGTDFGFSVVGPFEALQDANLHHLRFQLTKAGADTQFAVYIDGVSVKTGTMPGYALNGVALFRLYYSRFTGQTVMNVAHLAMWANANAAQIPAIADAVAAAFGYAGETAGERIQRVCDEGNIPVEFIGDPAQTTAMGPQFSEPRLAQIRDAEATDFGILTEQRAGNGLLYRTRVSMYAQTPAVTIDYSDKVVAPPFEPTDDDEATRNDVTASRRDGGSFQKTLTTGRMSVLDPPGGIGQYEDEVTVNVETDAQLPGVAAWWLNLGTLDAARFPSVTFNLAAAEIDDTLRDQILALEVGDRMPITSIFAADIPDDVDLIIQGYTETITNTTWEITFNCAPGQPYQVAKFGTARYDADGSVLTAALDSDDTTFQVSNNGSTVWTTDPAVFGVDLNIGGERLRILLITGTNPQTITAARSINGVVKSHAAGTPVRLWDTPRFAY